MKLKLKNGNFFLSKGNIFQNMFNGRSTYKNVMQKMPLVGNQASHSKICIKKGDKFSLVLIPIV